MDSTVLCSTGIITHYPKFPDHKPIIENRDRIDIDQYELMVFPNWYGNIDEILTEFVNSDISFPAIHADKRFGSRICEPESEEYENAFRVFEQDCRIASELQSDIIILHLWGLPCSDIKFDNNLKALNRCIEIAKSYNIRIAVEPIYGTKSTPLENAKDNIEELSRMRHNTGS